MLSRTSILSFAVALAFAGAASAQVASVPTTAPIAPPAAAPITPPESTKAADPMTETSVRALLVGAGFTEINDVKFKGGSWTADAKSADGNHVELRIDSATGKIYPDEPVATIGKDQIIVLVQAAGYTNVHDVEMEDGVWKAEADDSKGNDVELKLDPNDGHVIGAKNDVVGAAH
jgi:hypothetical protein